MIDFKESIVHLEGIDKTGKDTIRQHLITMSNGRILVIVRSYISQIAYSRIYQRNIDESFFFQKMQTDYNLGVKFILLYSDKRDLAQRFRQHQETDLNFEDVEYHQNIFNNVVQEAHEKYGIWILKLNTSQFTPTQTAERILEWISLKNIS